MVKKYFSFLALYLTMSIGSSVQAETVASSLYVFGFQQRCSKAEHTICAKVQANGEARLSLLRVISQQLRVAPSNPTGTSYQQIFANGNGLNCNDITFTTDTDANSPNNSIYIGCNASAEWVKKINSYVGLLTVLYSPLS